MTTLQNIYVPYIDLDQVMARTLTELYEIDLSSYKVKENKNILGKYLSRMEQILRAETLPPIQVEKYEPYVPPHRRGDNIDKFRYKILNGRHRVCAAIINGDDIIKAELV